jgi:hypothetical protein
MRCEYRQEGVQVVRAVQAAAVLAAVEAVLAVAVAVAVAVQPLCQAPRLR